MRQYLDQCNYIIANGRERPDRTGTGALSVFGYQMRFNLQEGFPLLTTKHVFVRGIIEELLWFLRGETNVKPLKNANVSIWNEWAVEPKHLNDATKYSCHKVFVDPSRWFDLVWGAKLDPESEAYKHRQDSLSVTQWIDFDYLDFLIKCGIDCTEVIEISNHVDRERVLLYLIKTNQYNPGIVFDDYLNEKEKIITDIVKNNASCFTNEVTERGITDITPLIHTLLDKWGAPPVTNKPVLGELGPIYGKQWRSWDSYIVSPPDDVMINETMGYTQCGVAPNNPHDHVIMVKHIDQIKELIKGLKEKPFSRRHVVSAWNVGDLPDESQSPQDNVLGGRMALAPCHAFFQFYVTILTEEERNAYFLKTLEERQNAYWEGLINDEQMAAGEEPPLYGLSCQLYQRSVDVAAGEPFNIASYALLTHMIAQVCNMVPLEFIHTSGDAHLYKNHIEIYKEQQMNRRPFPLPKLTLNPKVSDIFKFTASDILIEDYHHHPKINYPISV